MAAKGVRTGQTALPRSAGEDAGWLKVEDGEPVMVAFLTGLSDLVSIDQHALWRLSPAPIFMCIGDDCPGCQLGDKAKYKGFLGVLTKDDGPKIFAFGSTVARQLSEYEEELGNLAGKNAKIKRTGKGLSTKWTVIVTAKEVDVSTTKKPNIVAQLGPQDREGILALIKDKGVNFENELTAYLTKSAEKDDEPPIGKSPKSTDDGWEKIDV